MMLHQLKNKHGRLLLLLLIFVTTIGINTFGQKSEVFNFNYETQSIEGDEKFPYGEQLILKGEAKAKLESLIVYTQINNNERVPNIAKIIGKSWLVKIGPFPVKSNILVEIEETRKLSHEEFQKVTDLVKNAIFKISNDFAIGSISMTTDKYASYTIDGIQSQIGNKLNGYKAKDGTNLREAVLLNIKEKFDNHTALNLFSNLKKIEEIKNTSLYDSLKLIIDTLDAKKNPISGIPIEEFLCVSDTTTIRKILQNFGSLAGKGDYFYNYFNRYIKEKYRDRYLQGRHDIDTIINNLEVIKSEVFITSLSTYQQVMDIQSFMGFDVGMIYIKELSMTPFFITVSPYLKRIEQDGNYQLFKDDWRYLITPTFGVGINENDQKIKPIYYVGIGIRLNKAVRVGVGGTYYTPFVPDIPNENSDVPIAKPGYQASLAISISISINYLSDFIKLFSAAGSNFQP